MFEINPVVIILDFPCECGSPVLYTVRDMPNPFRCTNCRRKYHLTMAVEEIVELPKGAFSER